MRQYEVELTDEHIQQLSKPGELIPFFEKLGYDTGTPEPQVLSSLKLDITLPPDTSITCISSQGDPPLALYLFELGQTRNLPRKMRDDIVQSMRGLEGEQLLVITTPERRWLEFVLIERYIPVITTAWGDLQLQSLFADARPGHVRPRVLHVDPLKPNAITRRVLSRLTYTEASSHAQYDKLLAAFTAVGWTEEYFNNRSLFSDHYLKERLPTRPEWKSAQARIEGDQAYRAIREQYLRAREMFTQDEKKRASKGVIRMQLLEPALQALGFTLRPKQGRSGESMEPDYFLYAGQDTSNPLAFCLTYPWGRSLDGRDDLRDKETPDENPGALVVTLLDSGQAQWAIVTNGVTWRLYSAKAYSRASNYYEVDLPWIWSLPNDPPDYKSSTAFHFFWLLFRARSYIPATQTSGGAQLSLCLLDILLDESRSYARNLEDEIKDRVFKHIFELFARGFIEHARRNDLLEPDMGTLPTEERAEQLASFFTGTLTFLYRLLFLLYAESRGLLPLHQEGDYDRYSLEDLKQRVAAQAGKDVRYVEARLAEAYSNPDSTVIYESLRPLFEAINRGKPELNVPRYNGGLFITDPNNDDRTPAAASARFLNAHKIPDFYLALGLDRLVRGTANQSRDQEDLKASATDDRTYELLPIDYKSLGVRQLGSIYEGLLEFKLRVAVEPMVEVKGKRAGVNEMLSLTESRQTNRRPHRQIDPPQVYLENDRHERKATGSYYTPDSIVKYIVARTIGPVLQRKFEELRPVFHEAEKRLRTALQEEHSNLRSTLTPEQRIYEEFIETLNDAFFDFKVLDPAMGSGHFLVEAVDYITDQMTRMISTFRWNPIIHELRLTREHISKEMAERGITLDETRLTDLDLLKRRVLKSCIYGVDLNPMAVELAKVSLWLNCFTLGAPLSLLDHHLKCGNSLFGANLQSVVQTNLFSQSYDLVGKAAELVRSITKNPEITTEESDRAQAYHREAAERVQPVKDVLSIWLSEYFGNHKAQLTASSLIGEIVERQFAGLNQADKAAIEKAIGWPQPTASGGQLGVEREAGAATDVGRPIADRMRFFHRELEFLDVYFDDFGRRENEGFHAVVGNPPWGAEFQREEKQALRRSFKTGQASSPDSYAIFTEVAIDYLNQGGHCGFIVPDTLLRKDDLLHLRRLLLSTTQVVETVETGPLFSEVRDTWCLVLIAAKLEPSEAHMIRHEQISRFIVSAEERLDLFGQQCWSRNAFVPQRFWQQRPNMTIGFLSSTKEQAVIESIERSSIPLLQHRAGFKISRGEEGSKLTFAVHRDAPFKMVIPLQVERYWVDEGVSVATESLTAGKLNEYYTHPKIWVIRIQKVRWQQRIVASFDERANSAGMKTLQIIVSTSDNGRNLLFLQALLVSRLLNFWCTNFLVDDLNQSYLEKLPVPPIDFIATAIDGVHDLDQAKIYYRRYLSEGDRQCLLDYIASYLENQGSYVVHDLLAFLGEEMLGLNKEKHVLQEDFLNRLAATLGVQSDAQSKEGLEAWADYRKLLDFSGDYRRGQRPLTEVELWAIVQRNRARLRPDLSWSEKKNQILADYEYSLKHWLGPLNERLQRTDELIDQIVYRLYGLTKDERDIVERCTS